MHVVTLPLIMLQYFHQEPESLILWNILNNSCNDKVNLNTFFNQVYAATVVQNIPKESVLWDFLSLFDGISIISDFFFFNNFDGASVSKLIRKLRYWSRTFWINSSFTLNKNTNKSIKGFLKSVLKETVGFKSVIPNKKVFKSGCGTKLSLLLLNVISWFTID